VSSYLLGSKRMKNIALFQRFLGYEARQKINSFKFELIMTMVVDDWNSCKLLVHL